MSDHNWTLYLADNGHTPLLSANIKVILYWSDMHLNKL